MESKKLEECVKKLRSGVPILGKTWRRAAVRELAADSAANTVPHLAAALQSEDGEVRAVADAALAGLKAADARDALCAIALKAPGGPAASLCVRAGHAPSTAAARRTFFLETGQLTLYFADPDFDLLKTYYKNMPAARQDIDTAASPQMRLLSGCWTGANPVKTELDLDEVVNLLAAKLPAVRSAAATTLSTLPDPSLQSLLCERALAAANSELIQICVKSKFVPLDPGRASVFLLVTGQTDACLSSDPGFARLKLAYSGADAGLRSVIDAAVPADIRVLSGCWTGVSGIATVQDVGSAAALLRDTRPGIAAASEDWLRQITRSSLQSALCDAAIADPAGPAARLCKELGFVPVDDERACLYLFVTRQLDAFFDRDPDFVHLNIEYARGDATLKARIMEVVQTGDNRCLGFLGRAKPLADCTDREIEIALNSARRHEEWGTLWSHFKELPLRYTEALPGWLAEANWRPTDSDDASLFDAVRQIRAEGAALTHVARSTEQSVFERWMEDGRTGRLSKQTVSELMKQLANADPPDGVKIVGALADRIEPDSPEGNQVVQNQHWMIRLAGYAAGMGTGNADNDPVVWVKELAGAATVLNVWPAQATPGALRKMQEMPAEAFIGHIGAQRRVAIAIISFLQDRAQFEKDVKEGAIFRPM